MPRQGVHAHEVLTASTGIWLVATVNLRVPLQVVWPDECLAAVDASVLAVAKMSLHVGPYILPALEALFATTLEQAQEGI
jgi:hypothetical protein